MISRSLARLLAVGLVAVMSAAPNARANPADGVPDEVTTAYRPVAPCRLVDTRTDAPGRRADGESFTVQVADACGLDSAIEAVALTITAVDTGAAGFVTAFPTGVERPVASHLSWVQPDETRANGVIVKTGDGGSITVFTRGETDLVIDTTGGFVPVDVATGGRFVALSPARILDTRDRTSSFADDGILTVALPTEVADDAIAVAVNITITENAAPTFLTAFAHGTARPNTSLVNADAPSQTRAATAIVPIVDGAFDIFTRTPTEAIVDIAGYFTGAAAPQSTDGLFVAADPARSFDSTDGEPIYGGGAIHVASTDAASRHGAPPRSAVVLNLTATENLAPGFVTAWPADTERPNISSVNMDAAETTIANLAIVPVTQRGINLYAKSTTDVLVDIAGWFTGPFMPGITGIAPVTNPAPTGPTGPAFDPALTHCDQIGHGAVVDKAAQRFWLCDNSTPITGSLKMTTASAGYGLPPLGKHSVFSKDVRGYGAHGEVLHRFVSFYRTARGNRIGFHQYVDQDPATVGDLDQRGASAGCLRVSTDDSWTVWEHLSVGDTVIVITN